MYIYMYMYVDVDVHVGKCTTCMYIDYKSNNSAFKNDSINRAPDD